MPSEQENFVSRWSRRKQEANDPVAVDQKSAVALAFDRDDDSDTASLEVAEAVEPVLTDADMPAIETLHEDSDFSGFMSIGVSDELRNLALKKLFKAAVFNVRDGLDEYDEDYTSFESLGDIITCDMKHQIEMEAKKKLEAEAEALMDADEATQNEDVSALAPTEPVEETDLPAAVALEDTSPEAAFSASDDELALHESNPESEKI